MKKTQTVFIGIMAIVLAAAFTACPGPNDVMQPTTGTVVGAVTFADGATGSVTLELKTASGGAAYMSRNVTPDSTEVRFTEVTPGTFYLYANVQGARERLRYNVPVTAGGVYTLYGGITITVNNCGCTPGECCEDNVSCACIHGDQRCDCTGFGMAWLGEHNEPPMTPAPQPGWAFFNTSTGNSYIWAWDDDYGADGSYRWNILVRGGQPGQDGAPGQAVPVTSITLTGNGLTRSAGGYTLNIAPGDSVVITADVTPDNAIIQTILWSFTGESVTSIESVPRHDRITFTGPETSALVRTSDEGGIGTITVIALGTGGTEVRKTITVNVTSPYLDFYRSGEGYAVTGFSGTATTVVIPTVHNGLPIVAIYGGAFAGWWVNHGQLTGVIIPDSVTYIGERAFRHNRLTNVSIPGSVTYIGEAAFSHNRITSVTIPDGVTSIGSSVFSHNQLTSVTIPGSVTSIMGDAFYYNRITSVTIPDSVTYIGWGAFSHNQLTSVTIPGSVTSIMGDAFYYNRITSVTIPDSVTYIGWGAFGNNQLTNVTIPNSVTHLSGFNDNQLTSVIIPSSVTHLSGFSGNQLTSVTIPDGVTSIGNHAFSNNQLTSVTIPDGVTIIEGWTFAGNQLTSVAIPDGVTSIVSHAFSNNQLTSVTIPDSVNFIWNEAFAGNNLTNVTIPVGVIEIMSGAFANNQLASVTIPDGVTIIDGWTFAGNQLTNVTIPDGVTFIGEEAFANNQLISVTIPDIVFYIGQSAFANNQLTSVEIPASVTSIGHSAFAGNQLASVTIPFATLEEADQMWNSQSMTWPWQMGPWWRYDIPDTVTWIFAP